MSVGGIDIHPKSLAEAGRRLADVSEQMAGAVTELHSAVTSNNPWGGDETGTLFAGIYNAVLGHALEALESYVEQVAYAGAALTQQAQETTETDAAAASRFSNAGNGL